MLRQLLNKIKFKNNESIMLLGRWSTIASDTKNTKDNTPNINFNIDAGNHDHCGSELCVKTPIKKMKNNKKNDFNMTEQEMFPFII